MNSTKENNIKKDKRKLRVRKKERTKNTILAKATIFFSDKSFKDVLLEDIAEAAFVSRATLYNYFKNKDELHFAVANQIYRTENEAIADIISSDLSGKKLVLHLCEKSFKDSVENPLLRKVFRGFMYYINDRNLSSGEIYDHITKKIGTTQLNSLIETPSLLDEFNFEEYFDDHYFICSYIQFIRHGNLWVQAIQRGKKDKTIKNDLEDLSIAQYINILMYGMVNEMELRKTALDRINMKRETFITNSLHLISIFLDKNV